MKLATSLLAATVTASHYRGGTYKVEQTEQGTLKVTNTQTWRLGSDLYSGGCQQSDVTNQVPSDSSVTGSCSGGNCQSQALKYTALFVGSDYCYGDGVNVMPKPSSAFNFGWSSCCWVSLTADSGSSYSAGGTMQMKMQFNDLDNNSPTFKLPPLWLIMAGCPNQMIDLAPSDMDGDKVKCRWATASESGGAFNDGRSFPSLSLDEENCIVHYDGTKDSTAVGVKPIGLMMEDFDSNNQVRSSIPVQFLAQVWTPSMNTRSIGEANYPQWFPDHDHEEDPRHEDVPSGNIRGRRSVPSYCNAVPSFTNATPADGAVIDGRSGNVSFTLQASSENGAIIGFSYQAPSGLICTSVNGAGEITCNWTLTAAQLKVEEHQFCYDATDSLGLKTERRCLTIEGIGNKITNISSMAAAVLDGSGANGFTAADGVDYGCAGRGTYDFKSTTIGAQVDQVDKAFYVWKKCVQCAVAPGNTAPEYEYDQANDSCGKYRTQKIEFVYTPRSKTFFNLFIKSILLMLLVVFVSVTVSWSTSSTTQKPTTQITTATHADQVDFIFFRFSFDSFSGGYADTDCCNWDTFYYANYNIDTHCCARDGVKEIGTC